MPEMRMALEPDDELLSIPQVARELGISRTTAYIRILAGRIPARRVLDRYVVRRRDLEDLRGTVGRRNSGAEESVL